MEECKIYLTKKKRNKKNMNNRRNINIVQS